MSDAPFTPEQEVRVRDLIDERLVARAPDLFLIFWAKIRKLLKV